MRCRAVVALIAGIAIPEAAAQQVRGLVTSRGVPVADVNVFLRETLEGALTDSAGRFSFATGATGALTVVAQRIGFRAYASRITLDTASRLRIDLVREPTMLAPVTAVASRFAAGEERGASLTTLDVVSTPGTTADVARAVQTLPGTSAVDEGTALFVRGGDHSETTLLLDGAVLHSAFSYESPNGTFIGTVDPFLLDGIVFAAGGFGARYGNALSGIAALRTLGRPSRSTMTIGAGLAALSASAAWAAPRGLSLRAAANQTDTRLLFRVNGSTGRYAPPPRGFDRSLGATWNYGDAGEVKVFAITQRTKLGTGIDESSYSGTFDMAVDGTLGVVNWTDVVGRWSPFARASRTAMSRTQDYGAFRMLNETRYLAGAAGTDFRAAHWLTLRGGIEWEDLRSTMEGSVPDDAYDRKPGARVTVVSSQPNGTRTGAFTEADFVVFSRARVIAGVRQDRASLTGSRTTDPRLSMALTIVPGVVVTGAWGVYHQVPDPLFLDPTLGDPTVAPMRATHAIAGVQLGREGALVRVEAYDKAYDDLAQLTRDYDVVGHGSGRARGVDVFATGQGWRGMRWRHSTSAVRSRRTDPNSGVIALAPFDVPWTTTTVVQQALPYSLHLAATWRTATGKPFTPVESAAYDAARRVWVPQYGAPMSERMPDFRRLDIGLTHLRQIAGMQAVFYSGVTNLLDRDNLYTYRYSADYRTRIPIRSLFNRGIYVGLSITAQ